jgi:hypothetical protein
MPEPMLTKRSQGESETEAPTGAGQALMIGESVAGAFQENGGELGNLCRETLARDLAEVVQPLLGTCTNAERSEAINARLDLLERDTGKPGSRLVRFEANGVAKMSAPAR